jgi:iron complex outermembrane receptor protein
VGFRYDHTSSDARNPEPDFERLSVGGMDRSDDTVAAFAAVSLLPADGWRLTASMARGVRAPTISERYVYLLPVGVDRYDYLGEPGLRPEVNHELDFGVGYAEEVFELAATCFVGWQRNLISARVDEDVAPSSPGVLGVKRYFNVPRAFRTGLELEGQLELGAGFSLSGVFFWLRGTAEDLDDPLPQIPPAEGTLSLGYRHADGRWWARVSGRFVDRQDRTSEYFGESPTPGFGLLELRGGVSLGKGVAFTVALENALDKTYYEHLNRSDRSSGSPINEPGRNLHLMLSVGL